MLKRTKQILIAVIIFCVAFICCAIYYTHHLELQTKKIEVKIQKEPKDVESKNETWHVSYSDESLKFEFPIENGAVKVSDEELNTLVKTVFDTYTTLGGTYIFTTHNGENILVPSVTLGSDVDMDAEKEALQKLIQNNESKDNRTPIYKVSNELGDTYVEVSIGDQHVWYVKNGEIVMDSDCVTGNVSRGNDTPRGAFYIFETARNRTLRPKGSKTGSFVNVWMPFSPDRCGLHDATWRDKFGGDIYLTNGSHGCVNLPKQFALALFEEAYVGLPVIVY